MTTETIEQAAPKKKRAKTTRRGYGEGSIFQRKDGRWSAVISMGYGADGKRLRRTVYGDTKAAVQEELSRLHGSKFDGTLTTPSKAKLADFLKRWLDDVAKLKVRERTLDNYQRAVNRHISPKLGGIRVDKLSAAQVAWLYAELERGNVGAQTRRLCHAVLRQAMQTAVKWKLAVRNPCLDVDAPAVSAKEIEPLTTGQVSTLFTAAKGSRLEALYLVAITGGMRLGELFGLQWADVDLDSGVLFVRHALQELNGKLMLGEPKTKKSKRNVTLPKLAVDALHEHRKRQLAAGHLASGYVFTNTEGNPLRRSHFHRNEFKPLLTAAGLPQIRFHDLRHTSATLLMVQGVHPKIVSERLGHSKVGITMDLYSHVQPSSDKEAAGRFDRLFAASAG